IPEISIKKVRKTRSPEKKVVTPKSPTNHFRKMPQPLSGLIAKCLDLHDMTQLTQTNRSLWEARNTMTRQRCDLYSTAFCRNLGDVDALPQRTKELLKKEGWSINYLSFFEQTDNPPQVYPFEFLEGRVEKVAALCPNVTKIDNVNWLHPQCLKEFAAFKKLEHLHVKHTTGSILSELSSLSSLPLESLILTESYITDGALLLLSKFSHLRFLDLSSNEQL